MQKNNGTIGSNFVFWFVPQSTSIPPQFYPNYDTKNTGSYMKEHYMGAPKTINSTKQPDYMLYSNVGFRKATALTSSNLMSTKVPSNDEVSSITYFQTAANKILKINNTAYAWLLSDLRITQSYQTNSGYRYYMSTSGEKTGFSSYCTYTWTSSTNGSYTVNNSSSETNFASTGVIAPIVYI